MGSSEDVARLLVPQEQAEVSGGQACKCSEKDEAIVHVLNWNRPGRLWRVVQRHSNHSAFSGNRYTPSDYSALRCLRCGASWRTKAHYVTRLRDIAEDEENISCGYDGHIAAMEARGRTPHPNNAGKG